MIDALSSVLCTILERTYPGTIITQNNIPDETACICVYDTGGYEAIRHHGRNSCKVLRPTAQIRIRHHDLRTARIISLEIYEALDGIYSQTIDSTHCLSINCGTPPVYIGKTQVSTKGTAHEYTLNLYSKIQS